MGNVVGASIWETLFRADTQNSRLCLDHLRSVPQTRTGYRVCCRGLGLSLIAAQRSRRWARIKACPSTTGVDDQSAPINAYMHLAAAKEPSDVCVHDRSRLVRR